MGDDGDDLLGEDVERVAQEAGGLDVALVHGAGDGGAGDEVGAVLGEDDAVRGSADLVAGAADALHAAGDRGRRFDLDDEVDGAHVDAELERGGGDEGADLAGLEQLLDLGALGGGERAVVGAGDGLAGEIVEGAGEALGDAAGVDEDEGRGALADELEQARVDGLPDGGLLGALRRRSAVSVICTELGHVLDGDLDPEVEELAGARVDDGDGTEARCGVEDVCRIFRLHFGAGWWLVWCRGRFGAAEEAGDLFEGALGGGEADALQAASW